MTTVLGPRREADGQGDRLARHRRLRAWLQDQSDREVLALELREAGRSVWSATAVVSVEGEDVFVKRVPVTDRELGDPYSTRNHFGLPVFYQYGVGSAGFGAFREAAALETVTNWVLSGEPGRFPLLYHQRLLPGSPGPWLGRMRREDYVGYWAGSRAVAEMMAQRMAATHELWLFIEHVPYTVSDWLMAHQGRLDMVIDQMAEATAVLRERGVVHFDAHLANVMTDGVSLYLADFGLACAPGFDLSPTEEGFLARHPHYDLGLAMAYLGLMLALRVNQSSPELRDGIERACGLAPGADRFTTIMGLVDGARKVAEFVDLAPEYLVALERYRDVNEYMHRFITRLQAGPDKSAPYDDNEVLSRLRGAGAPHVA